MYSVNCECESFTGSSSCWQQVIHLTVETQEGIPLMVLLCVPEQVELPPILVGSPSLEVFKWCLDVAPEIQGANLSKANIDANYKF